MTKCSSPSSRARAACTSRPGLLVLLAFTIIALLTPPPTVGQLLQWEQVGTRLHSGIIESMAMDSTGTVYVGTYNGGVFRSLDGGRNWLAPESWNDVGISEIHAGAGGILLARDRANSALLRSTDRGRTWDSVAPAGVIAIDDRAELAYAIGSRGVFRSSDHGAQWEKISDNLPVSYARAAVVHAGSGALLLAGDRAIHRSDDRGLTWRRTVDSLGTSTYASVMRLQSMPGGNIVASGYRVGILRSTDGGESWVTTMSGIDVSSRSWTLAVSASGELLAVGDSGQSYRSLDGGDGWLSVGASLGLGPRALLLLGDGVVLAGLDYYGVERSSDGGRTYAPSLDGLYFRGELPNVEIDSRNRVLATTFRLVYRSDTAGRAWERLAVPRSALPVAPLVAAPGGWIVAGAVQSLDDGATWRVETDGLTAFGQTLADMDFDGVTGKVFAATRSGTYAIERGGTEWGWPRLGGIALSPIKAHPSGVLLVGSQTDGGLYSRLIYRSIDGGNEWDASVSGLEDVVPGDGTADFAVDASGDLFAATTRGIYRSTDLGAVWQRLPIGPDSATRFIRIVANPRGPIVAFAPDSGMGRFFISSDGGETWTSESSRLPGSVGSLAIDSVGRIYAGITDARVYRTIGSTSTVGQTVRAGTEPLLSVHPNPARDAVTIDVTLPPAHRCVLTVRDLLGRTVLAVPSFDAASPVLLDVSGLTTGLYAVQVASGAVSATRTIVVRR